MSNRRLKIASHIHSDFSDDSDWSLPRLSRLLSRAGFDGALVSDHDRTMTEQRRTELVAACQEFSSPTFTLVPGVEYQDPDHVVHVPVFGDMPFFGRSPDIASLLAESSDRGCVSVFAHPRRREAARRFDPAWVPHLTGIEVWNRKYDGIQPNRWARATAATYGLQTFVGLDFHGPRQLFPLTMSVDVPSNMSLTAHTIVTAITTGHVRSCAFGMNVTSFTDSYLSVIFSTAEAVRAKTAPLIRRAEQVLRSKDAGTNTPHSDNELRPDNAGRGTHETGA